MDMETYLKLPYRPNVGVALLNAEGLVFAGQRIDNPGDAWQMPQGGVDPGEEAYEAALRELTEETGVPAEKTTLIAAAPRMVRYDLPPELAARLWRGRWRGQAQQWFALRLVGTDADINIQTEHPEFSDWRWMRAADLLEKIVPFKRPVYEEVFEMFAEHLA